MVAGVSPKVKGQLDRTETTSEILGAENVFVVNDDPRRQHPGGVRRGAALA